MTQLMSKENNTYRITDLDTAERPRERLEKLGAQALNQSELLAILLRVGIQGENAIHLAQRILRESGGLRGLHTASFQEVCQQKGIGPAKAAQIKAAIELGRRLGEMNASDRLSIQSPDDAAALVSYEMSALPQEHLWVLNLNTRNQVININKLYKGSLNASTVRIGELFKDAIQRNAAAIILVHNHPSGDPMPSPEDIRLTKTAIEAGKLLDIKVLDHLVIGDGRYVSLSQKKLAFE